MALRGDGTVMVWGYLNPTYSGPYKTTTPVEVEGLSRVTAIAAGSSFRLALLDDGVVESWGGDYYGQLGGFYECTIDVACRAKPAPVEGLGEVTAIAASGANSLALLKNGS